MKKSEDKAELKIPRAYKKLAEIHFKIMDLEDKKAKAFKESKACMLRTNRLNIEIEGERGHLRADLGDNGKVTWVASAKDKVAYRQVAIPGPDEEEEQPKPLKAKKSKRRIRRKR